MARGQDTGREQSPGSDLEHVSLREAVDGCGWPSHGPRTRVTAALSNMMVTQLPTRILASWRDVGGKPGQDRSLVSGDGDWGQGHLCHFVPGQLCCPRLALEHGSTARGSPRQAWVEGPVGPIAPPCSHQGHGVGFTQSHGVVRLDLFCWENSWATVVCR